MCILYLVSTHLLFYIFWCYNDSTDNKLGVIGVDFMTKIERIKQRTLELYDSLPQDAEERKKRIDVRDEVIELNYKFFGYIAANTFVQNNCVTYDDKLQSALMHFCECWWWYKYAARYRTDLSFTVFFKPRIQEMITRELNEVKYSTRRQLCIEASQKIGKHWTDLTYEDLSNIELPIEKLNSLKAIFGVPYVADISDHESYLVNNIYESSYDPATEEFDTIESLLIHDMVVLGTKLSDKELRKMSHMYDIDFNELKSKLPKAEMLLYKKLHEEIDIRDTYFTI